MEWKHPSIIAMKGFPHTGKTSIAFALAMKLRICVLLELDKILDSITPPHDGSTAAPPEADKLTALAFDILCGLVEDQLRSGLSVIIDSLPLSRPQLDRLVTLSRSPNRKAKFIIVDCEIPPDRMYGWQRRFKEDCCSSNPEQLKWYKPRDWYDVEKLIKGYDKRLDDPIDGVSRLSLNVDKYFRDRSVSQAIQALIFCPDDRDVNYNDLQLVRLSDPKKASCFDDGHRVSIFKGQGLVGYEANCGVCEKPVLGAAYACNRCKLALHRSCAEMDSTDKRFRSFSPQDFPTFIRKIDSPKPNQEEYTYSFPEKYACLHCREAGEGFSDECSSCIFESHLKCGLIPTIINHDCHQHKLFFLAMRISSKGVYKCAACGKAGAYACYACSDGCETIYHVECALLPYLIEEHLHGGHKHRLELKHLRDKVLENYPCYHCPEMMNPEDWYYYCRICRHDYHLECAFKDDD